MLVLLLFVSVHADAVVDVGLFLLFVALCVIFTRKSYFGTGAVADVCVDLDVAVVVLLLLSCCCCLAVVDFTVADAVFDFAVLFILLSRCLAVPGIITICVLCYRFVDIASAILAY